MAPPKHADILRPLPLRDRPLQAVAGERGLRRSVETDDATSTGASTWRTSSAPTVPDHRQHGVRHENVIAPSVAVNNPRFTVMARIPDQWAQAIVAEEVLNYQWRANRYQDEFRLTV